MSSSKKEEFYKDDRKCRKTLCSALQERGNRQLTRYTRAIFWNDEKCVSLNKKGGIDAVTKKQTTYMIRAGKSITPIPNN